MAVETIELNVGNSLSQGPQAARGRTETDDYIDEIARRRRSVVHPLFLFSFLMFCATLVAFAYLPNVVAYRVHGVINVAYCLALAQFGVTFLVAAAYAWWARSAVDPLIAEAHARLTAASVEAGR